MSSHDRSAQNSGDELVELRNFVVTLILVLIEIVIVVSPWILLFSSGWSLLFRWYLLPYPFVLVGFGLVMAFFKRRELLVRVRDWRAARKAREA